MTKFEVGQKVAWYDQGMRHVALIERLPEDSEGLYFVRGIGEDSGFAGYAHPKQLRRIKA